MSTFETGSEIGTPEVQRTPKQAGPRLMDKQWESTSIP